LTAGQPRWPTGAMSILQRRCQTSCDHCLAPVAGLDSARRYSNIPKPGLTIPSRRAMCGGIFIFKKYRRALRENILVGWAGQKSAIAQKNSACSVVPRRLALTVDEFLSDTLACDISAH
jgi:hypothetical protein